MIVCGGAGFDWPPIFNHFANHKTMLNQVSLIGRLGQDPTYTVLEGGATVAKISVATDERYKDSAGEWQTKTEWIKVIGWRYLADKLRDQAQKGTLLFIQGKITSRSYVKDDETRYVTEVVANVINVLKDGIPRAGELPTATDAPPAPTYTNRPEPQPTAADAVAAGGDLPF